MKYRANFQDYILSSFHHISGVHSLQVYENAGGYKTLKKALSQKAEKLRSVIKESGLRERGGIGLPIGMKWDLFPEDTTSKKYLICHAHGLGNIAHVDKFLLETNPHLLIEGMILAAKGLGVDKGYIYIKSELKLTVTRLKEAIKEAYKRHYLGRNILGEGFNFDLSVHEGAGGEVGNDETMIYSSMSGNRAIPQLDLPDYKKTGYRNLPTMLHYPQTLASLPWIVQNGIDNFKNWGTERSPGTLLISLLGDIQKPGVYEVPLGISIKDVIEKYGEGVVDGEGIKVIFPCGLASTPLNESMGLKTTLDYESLSAQNSYLGNGSLFILSEKRDLYEIAGWIIDSFDKGSCGACTPCREGIGQVSQLLKKGDELSLDHISLMASNIKKLSGCSYGRDFGTPIQGMVAGFRHQIVKSDTKGISK